MSIHLRAGTRKTVDSIGFILRADVVPYACSRLQNGTGVRKCYVAPISVSTVHVRNVMCPGGVNWPGTQLGLLQSKRCSFLKSHITSTKSPIVVWRHCQVVA